MDHLVCIHFHAVPKGTHFLIGHHTWLPKEQAQHYIDEGYGVEWNPQKEEPEQAELDKKPTSNTTKGDIQGYMDAHGIAYEDDMTKKELLKLV